MNIKNRHDRPIFSVVGGESESSEELRDRLEKAGFKVGPPTDSENEVGTKRDKERFETLVAHLPLGVAFIRADGVYEYINPKFEEIFGYGLAGLTTGRVWFKKAFPDPNLRRRVISAWIADFKDAAPGECNPRIFPVICKDGGQKEILFRPVVLADRNFLVIYEDITARKKWEETLRASEERFRELAELLPETIYEMDLEGNLTFVNRKAFDHFGYTQEEFQQGLNAFQMIIPEDRPKVRENINLILKGEKAGLSEYTAQRKDGCTYPALFHSAPIIQGGRPVGFRGFIIDITERKRVEEALRESELSYRTLARNLPGIVYRIFLREKDRMEFFNDAVEEITGFKPAELFQREGSAIDSLILAEERRLVSTAVRAAVRENHSFEIEYRLRAKDGRIRTVLERGRPIMGAEGKPLYIDGVIIDISDRKEAEEQLRESEARYRQLVEHAPAGILEIDLEALRILSVNDVMCQYTGYTKEEFLSLDPLDILTEESRQAFLERQSKVLSGEGVPETVEYRIKGKNNREFWTIINSRFSYKEGRAVRATTVVHDITERKRIEAERKELERQLQQAQKMEAIGTLAGGIAHDFNNLLMGIQGRTSLMLMGLDPSHHHFEHLKGIEDHVQSAADLTRQLLGFAQGGKYEVRPMEVNRVLEKTARMFGRTRKEIRIHKKFDPELSAVEVDRNQIEQVFLNLYLNAWQAMPGGGDLHLETENVVLDEQFRRSHQVEPGRYVKVTVADTGVGMDEVTRRRIFEPFFTTKGMGRGMGLGLASVYGILKNHGGTINVKSEMGRGAVFELYLPVSEKGTVQDRESQMELEPGSGTILLVDDDEVILEVGREMLEYMGYKVLTAGNGLEALKVYEINREEIDLVILDMIMPELGGGPAFERLKSVNPEIKVILSSGYSLDNEAAEMLDHGCRAFIQKPFTMNQLSLRIKEVLEAD